MMRSPRQDRGRTSARGSLRSSSRSASPPPTSDPAVLSEPETKDKKKRPTSGYATDTDGIQISKRVVGKRKKIKRSSSSSTNTSSFTDLLGSPTQGDEESSSDREASDHQGGATTANVVVRTNNKVTQLNSLNYKSVKGMEEEIRRAKSSDDVDLPVENFLSDELMYQLDSLVRTDRTIAS